MTIRHAVVHLSFPRFPSEQLEKIQMIFPFNYATIESCLKFEAIIYAQPIEVDSVYKFMHTIRRASLNVSMSRKAKLLYA